LGSARCAASPLVVRNEVYRELAPQERVRFKRFGLVLQSNAQEMRTKRRRRDAKDSTQADCEIGVGERPLGLPYRILLKVSREARTAEQIIIVRTKASRCHGCRPGRYDRGRKADWWKRTTPVPWPAAAPNSQTSKRNMWGQRAAARSSRWRGRDWPCACALRPGFPGSACEMTRTPVQRKPDRRRPRVT